MDEIDEKTHSISEYRHWEQTHCYLLEGDDWTLPVKRVFPAHHTLDIQPENAERLP